MDINLLVNVTSRAWALPILAQIDAGTPCRQAPLIAATGAGRTAFASSLSHLIDLGMLERNPGHGHPLRPEFRLTTQGSELAGIATRVLGHAQKSVDERLIRRAWSVPILAVTQPERRFGEIRQRLSPITDRALSQSLQVLEVNGLIRRGVDQTARPLRPTYRAIGPGAEIAAAVALPA